MEHGFDITLTREPGGTPLGDRIRGIFLDNEVAAGPLAEAFLVNASRAQLVAETIKPALRAGRTVLCDRYADATLAYQGYGRGLDLATLRLLCDSATGGLLPDKTLLVDLAVDEALTRLEQRAGEAIDRLEREDAGFHRRVREGYLSLAASDRRFVVLDGRRSPSALLDDAWQALAPLRASGG